MFFYLRPLPDYLRSPLIEDLPCTSKDANKKPIFKKRRSKSNTPKSNKKQRTEKTAEVEDKEEREDGGEDEDEGDEDENDENLESSKIVYENHNGSNSSYSTTSHISEGTVTNRQEGTLSRTFSSEEEEDETKIIIAALGNQNHDNKMKIFGTPITPVIPIN